MPTLNDKLEALNKEIEAEKFIFQELKDKEFAAIVDEILELVAKQKRDFALNKDHLIKMKISCEKYPLLDNKDYIKYVKEFNTNKFLTMLYQDYCYEEDDDDSQFLFIKKSGCYEYVQ